MAACYDTIEAAIGGGLRLFAHHELIHPLCSHSSELDLVKLRDRLGGDFDIVLQRTQLLALLRCSKCGRKGNMAIVFAATNTTAARSPQGLELPG